MKKNVRQIHLKFKLAESADGDVEAPESIQLLRTGEFRHFFGDFKIEVKDLKNMVKNFDKDVIPNDLALDFNHNNMDIAAGWFTNLRLQDQDQLWADVKWTKTGRETVEGEEFRYTSIEFDLDYQSPEDPKRFGPTMLGAALTNRPFVKGMNPVTQLSEKELEEMKELDELKGQVKLLSDKSDEQAKEIKTLTDASTGKDEKIKTLELEKAESGKKAVFDKMFSEGKVVEAQREHYMSGDMVKYSENAKPVNLAGGGKQVKDGGGDPVEDVEGKIIDLATKRQEKNKDLSEKQAIAEVLEENPALEKKYNALGE